MHAAITAWNQALPIIAPRAELSSQIRFKLADILREGVDFVDSERFHRPRREAEADIFGTDIELPQLGGTWTLPSLDIDGTREALCVKPTVLLNTQQEQVLFRRYNYTRFLAAKIINVAREEGLLRAREARDLLDLYTRARTLRDEIAETNMPLVLAMARRARLSEMDFSDLVSEGNMALLRAADKFDVDRGFKFSTYACRAILKAFSRAGAGMSRYRKTFIAPWEPEMERADRASMKHAQDQTDSALQVREIIDQDLAQLSSLERRILGQRFPVGHGADTIKAKTLAEVGKLEGLTKERVRQIQKKALVKLRHCLETLPA